MQSDHEDPNPVEEIYEIRRRISAEHGNDLNRLYEHYIEYQKQFADRLYSRLHPEEPARPIKRTRRS